MLEKITAGDICVFENGQRATVTAVYNRRENVTLWFNKDIKLRTDGYLEDDKFNYRYDGEPLVISYPNSIVKVIPC